ncbi:MAG: transglycosylase domain-containing protein [Tannerellaceae bacterium]|nr:transglycosylase domain-containing protein [Tannerellaceae bacterium]
MTKYYAEQKLQALKKQYNLDIRYRSVSLGGFDSIVIKGFTIVSDTSSLLLYAQTFRIKANFRKPDFRPARDIKGFEIEGLHIHYVRKTNQRTGSEEEPDYASYVRLVAEKLSSLPLYLPPYILIQGIHFSYRDENKNERTYYIPRLLISGNRFVAEMQNAEKGSQGKWICRGTYQDDPFKISLRLYALEQEKISLPLLTDYTRASLCFDTLAIDLQMDKNSKGQLLRGRAGVKGLSVYHEGLSPDTIFLGKGFASYGVLVGKNFLEVDSSATTIRYNRMQFKPYLRIEKNENWRLKLALDKNNFPADDFFASLPKGLFGHLDGLKVTGELSYHFLLDVDMTQVSNLVFESAARPRNFRILTYGNTDLRRMNGPFVHTIYDKGSVVRRFEVGNRHPDFRPIHAISRYLPPAIMHGEDFAFYNHRGFYQEAFHKSLVENIEARSFTRGASTLSMQLVKNVFLNSDKTMVRKLEEILIVWLIENNRLTSKSRMLEVYMNIIEWGPNVYGITEAARFYFAKEPAALTLSECIFLAYIIPYPKYIRNHFNGLRLKYPYYEFFRDAVKRLAQRNLISAEDAARAHPDLVFNGPVTGYLQR